MKIEILKPTFGIYKIDDISSIDLTQNYTFISKTDEEISLVCPQHIVIPNATHKDEDWRAFRIQGMLDFSLVGILAKISTLLAGHKIGIFAISTYNTDYILTKAHDFDKSVEILRLAGYEIIELS